jgi:hypothetical protein
LARRQKNPLRRLTEDECRWLTRIARSTSEPTSHQEGLLWPITLSQQLPPLRMLLVMDNLNGHRTPDLSGEAREQQGEREVGSVNMH